MKTLDNFYTSKDWIAFRKILIDYRTDSNGEIICARCGLPIYKKYDIIAHHKIKLTEDNVNDVNVTLNPDNVELIHFKCHNKEHQRYDGYKKYVYIVHGAPCAGKTTYVRDAAYDDDLILDIDYIWESVCKCDRYHKPNRLKANVFGIRDCIIEQVKQRKGMWRNAYIIGTYPLASDRQRLREMLGAELIHIDTDKETCLQRAPDDNWKQYIEDYFDAYTG